MSLMIAITLTIPPAARMLLIIGSVYGILQAAKKVPALTKILNGWTAIVFNIVLTACGLLITIPENQLYTAGTANALFLLVVTSMGAAGLHGTVKGLSDPTVLATVPPSTKVVEVPATLVPANPDAIPVKPETKL